MHDEPRIIESPDIERKDRIPLGQKATERFPVLHYGSVAGFGEIGHRFRSNSATVSEQIGHPLGWGSTGT
jgi:hypothetical protein